MLIIGIDPGLTGAVALLDNGRLADLFDMPTIANGKGASKVTKKIDPAMLAALLRRNPLVAGPCIVVIEQVASMAGQGAASVFSLGDTMGCVRSVPAVLGLRVELIAPGSWKRHFGLHRDKDAARSRAIQQWPEDAPRFTRVKDHNRAEAVLIAEYGRVRFV